MSDKIVPTNIFYTALTVGLVSGLLSRSPQLAYKGFTFGLGIGLGFHHQAITSILSASPTKDFYADITHLQAELKYAELHNNNNNK